MNQLKATLAGMLGEDRLAQISQVTVGIGGAGGLGSNVAVHLVRSGFKRLVIADFDKVEGSNLNRQFYFADQIGRPKVEALAENLRRINPELELSLWREKITEYNINAVFGTCSMWVEAFDEASSKKMLVEAGLKLGKKVVSASGLAGWGDTDRLQSKVWGPNLVVVGDGCSAVGPGCPPLSPRVGVAAAKQADTILTWALQGGDLSEN